MRGVTQKYSVLSDLPGESVNTLKTLISESFRHNASVSLNTLNKQVYFEFQTHNMMMRQLLQSNDTVQWNSTSSVQDSIFPPDLFDENQLRFVYLLALKARAA